MGAALHKVLANYGLPEVARMYLLHALSRLCCYWGPNLILHLMEKKGCGAQWKIQGSKSPRAELAWKAVLHNVKSDTIMFLIVSWAFHKLLRLGSKAVENVIPRQCDTTSDADDCVARGDQDKQENGWAGLRFTGPAPRLHTHCWQVAVGFLGFDAMFYWSHRLMHHRRLYKHCHKMHHQFHTPIGIACSYEHAVEGIVQMFNWYLPIGAAGYLNRNNGGLHISTLFYYHCFRWLETVDSHSGYELPFSPFHVLPFFGGARMHDHHHRAFNGSYGASFIWDRLCGTDSHMLREIIEEGGFLIGGKRVFPSGR